MYLLTLLENALDDTATLSGESAAPRFDRSPCRLMPHQSSIENRCIRTDVSVITEKRTKSKTINQPQNSPVRTDLTRKVIVFLVISDLKKKAGYRSIFHILPGALYTTIANQLTVLMMVSSIFFGNALTAVGV